MRMSVEPGLYMTSWLVIEVVNILSNYFLPIVGEGIVGVCSTKESHSCKNVIFYIIDFFSDFLSFSFYLIFLGTQHARSLCLIFFSYCAEHTSNAISKKDKAIVPRIEC